MHPAKRSQTHLSRLFWGPSRSPESPSSAPPPKRPKRLLRPWKLDRGVLDAEIHLEKVTTPSGTLGQVRPVVRQYTGEGVGANGAWRRVERSE